MDSRNLAREQAATPSVDELRLLDEMVETLRLSTEMPPVHNAGFG